MTPKTESERIAGVALQSDSPSYSALVRRAERLLYFNEPITTGEDLGEVLSLCYSASAHVVQLLNDYISDLEDELERTQQERDELRELADEAGLNY